LIVALLMSRKDKKEEKEKSCIIPKNYAVSLEFCSLSEPGLK